MKGNFWDADDIPFLLLGDGHIGYILKLTFPAVSLHFHKEF